MKLLKKKTPPKYNIAIATLPSGIQVTWNATEQTWYVNDKPVTEDYANFAIGPSVMARMKRSVTPEL